MASPTAVLVTVTWFACARCICCVKWLKMKEWHSLEKQVFPTHYFLTMPHLVWESGCHHRWLPANREQTLSERQTRKNGMGWELGEWVGRILSSPKQQGSNLCWDRPPKAEMLRFHMDPQVEISYQRRAFKEFLWKPRAELLTFYYD